MILEQPLIEDLVPATPRRKGRVLALDPVECCRDRRFPQLPGRQLCLERPPPDIPIGVHPEIPDLAHWHLLDLARHPLEFDQDLGGQAVVQPPPG